MIRLNGIIYIAIDITAIVRIKTEYNSISIHQVCCANIVMSNRIEDALELY